MKNFIYLLFGLAILAGPAAGQDFRVEGLGGGDQVFFWKNKDVRNEAMSLIAANVHESNPMLVMF